MTKVTATSLVSEIGHLKIGVPYPYVNPITKGVIEIVRVNRPEGPIIIKRYNPSTGETPSGAKEVSISPQQIWRAANAFTAGTPVNLDRVFGGSYNTRSVLESLIAHTPQFYFSYPGRIESIDSSVQVKKGHKHLIWMPDKPHKPGVVMEAESNMVISEIPSTGLIYDALGIPETRNECGDFDVARRHAQIQILLIMIGEHLGFRTWIAQNDRSIEYRGKKLCELPSVINSLRDENLITANEEAIRAALLIDCVWFKNGRLMPAVLEVEHSTGVTSGLTRMKGLQDAFPACMTRYVIVAADEERDKVIREANRVQFRSLDTRFLSYSAVEELYGLCKRRKLKGVTDEFLDCFMEKTISVEHRVENRYLLV